MPGAEAKFARLEQTVESRGQRCLDHEIRLRKLEISMAKVSVYVTIASGVGACVGAALVHMFLA